MNKNKKNLLILGGVVAGVLVIALGAFLLNPQGGVYKGALVTEDTKLVDTTVTRDLSIAEPEDEFPILLKPKDEDVTGEEIVGEIEEITNTETNTTIDTTTDTDPIILPVADDRDTTTTKEAAEEETVILPAADISKEEVSRTTTTSPNTVPEITPLNRLTSDTTNYNYYDLPAGIGSTIYRPVLAFELTAVDNITNTTDQIYLDSLDFDYKYCFGDAQNNPLILGNTGKPELHLNFVHTAAIVAIDDNLNGTFENTEFIKQVAIGQTPQEFSVQFFPLSCPAGTKGRVVLKDIAWHDNGGAPYSLSDFLYSFLANPFVEADYYDNDIYTVKYS